MCLGSDTTIYIGQNKSIPFATPPPAQWTRKCNQFLRMLLPLFYNSQSLSDHIPILLNWAVALAIAWHPFDTSTPIITPTAIIAAQSRATNIEFQRSKGQERHNSNHCPRNGAAGNGGVGGGGQMIAMLFLA